LPFLIGTIGEHGAARVTAVAPNLRSARKDRRAQRDDSVISRNVA